MPYYPAEEIDQLEQHFVKAARALRRKFGDNLYLFGFTMLLNDTLETTEGGRKASTRRSPW